MDSERITENITNLLAAICRCGKIASRIAFIAARTGEDSGFVVIVVLLFTGLIAAIALSLEILSISSRRDDEAVLVRERASIVLDAAVTRAIYALEQPFDPLIAAARNPTGYATWHYDGSEVAINISPDSGKIDLNAAPADFITSAVHLVLGAGPISDRTLARVEEHRQNAEPFELVEAALAPPDRFGSEAARFRQAFTIYSGEAGVDPLSAPNDVLRAIPSISDDEVAALLAARSQGSLAASGTVVSRLRGYFAAERPIYTITATLFGPESQSIQTATVMVSQNQHRAYVLTEREIAQPLELGSSAATDSQR